MHRDAINALAAAGIVRGTTKDRYAPASAVSRAQTASVMVRVHEYVTGEALTSGDDQFVDDDRSVHHDAINAAAAADLLVGVTPRRFDPGADVRRDQMATFLVRLLDAAVVAQLSSERVG